MDTHDSVSAHDASPESKAQQPIPQVTIAVMGATGSGKTSFVNLASGSNLRIGTNLESCTAEVELADKFVLDERPIVLIDTPGFDNSTKSDTDVLKLIAAFLATTYEAGLTLAGVIYIHRISDRRFSGIAGRNFRMFRELCGDTTLKNVVIVTNMWGEVSQDIGEAREKELATNFFKPVLDKGARLVRHHNTAHSAREIIRSITKNVPMPLQIQRELVEEGKDVPHTTAGETINKELNEKIRQHEADLKDVHEEMVRALEQKNEQGRQELEEERREHNELIKQLRRDMESMASGFQEEKRRMEEAIREEAIREEARKEREIARAAYEKTMDDLNRQLRDAANAAAAEREALKNRINDLQHQWDNRPQGGCLVM